METCLRLSVVPLSLVLCVFVPASSRVRVFEWVGRRVHKVGRCRGGQGDDTGEKVITRSSLRASALSLCAAVQEQHIASLSYIRGTYIAHDEHDDDASPLMHRDRLHGPRHWDTGVRRFRFLASGHCRVEKCGSSS